MVKGIGKKQNTKKVKRLNKHTVTLSDMEDAAMYKLMKPGEKVAEFIRRRIFQ